MTRYRKFKFGKQADIAKFYGTVWIFPQSGIWHQFWNPLLSLKLT